MRTRKSCVICDVTCKYEDVHQYFERTNQGCLQPYCMDTECKKEYHRRKYQQSLTNINSVYRRKYGQRNEVILNAIRARFKMWCEFKGDFK